MVKINKDTQIGNTGYTLEDVTNFFKVQTFSSNIGSLNPSEEFCNSKFSISVPSGYKPLGIVAFGLSGINYTRCYISFLSLSDNGTKIEYTIRNDSPLTTSSMTMFVDVLLKKSV